MVITIAFLRDLARIFLYSSGNLIVNKDFFVPSSYFVDTLHLANLAKMSDTLHLANLPRLQYLSCCFLVYVSLGPYFPTSQWLLEKVKSVNLATTHEALQHRTNELGIYHHIGSLFLLSQMKAALFGNLVLMTISASAHGAGLRHMRQHGKNDLVQPDGAETNDKTKTSRLNANHTLNWQLEQRRDAVSARMGAKQVDTLPLFVKFHKTGSGTAAALFRQNCHVSMQIPSLRGVFPWRGGPHCGPLPHEQ